MLNDFFEAAFQEAEKAVERQSGGPFGAVVVCRDQIVGRGYNSVLIDNDPTAHAEIKAIREAAAKMSSPHLSDCFLVTTSEPCPMCLMAVHWANLQKVYYAAPRSLAARSGFRDEKLYHLIEGSGVELVAVNDFKKRAEELFTVWQKQGGQLY